MPGSIVNAMPGSSGTAGLADVVHVDPDVVRRAVRVPDPVLFAAGVGDQPELQQARLDHLDRAAVNVLQRRARPRGLNPFLLRLQHDLVDVLLRGRERAADRIGARDVARQVLEVARGVDQQQIAGLHLPRAVGVVQDRRVRPAADNRRIARDGAAAVVHGLDGRLHLVLVGARPGRRACPPGARRSRSRSFWRGPSARTASSRGADPTRPSSHR